MAEFEDLQADFSTHRIEGYSNHGHMKIDCPLITPVDDNLWQGGCIDGVSLGGHFKHVISLYPWERYTWKGMLDSFTEVKLYDSNNMPDLEQLDRLANWINVCRRHGRTLVHCQAGLNRSALLTALAIAKDEPETPMADIVTRLREKRSPVVLCNQTFERYLLDYR